MQRKNSLIFSIVIPAYNETKNFKRGRLNELFDFLQKQYFSWEIIFVNDGSTDDTLPLLNKLGQKYPAVKILDIVHGGKAGAVKAGVGKAKGEFVLFTDFDQSTPIPEVIKVLRKFEKGADVVIARRKHVHGWPMPQRIRSKMFNLLVQLLILPGIADTQCGFKAFRTSIARNLFNNLLITKGAQKGRFMGAFDVELLFLARKKNYKIQSIDVNWYCVRAGSLTWLEPLKMLLNIITVRVYDTMGRYSKI